ncbi:hypothetical protein L6R52_35100 [Myxococcota bacterium]|nr:hypothetical protein [Myxococcota bacterium]
MSPCRGRLAGLVVAVAAIGCVGQRPSDLPDTSGARTMIVLARSGDASAATVVALDGGVRVPVALDAAGELFVFLYAEALDELRLAPGPVALAAPAGCGRVLPQALRVRHAHATGGPLAWTDPRAGGLDVPELRVRPTPGVCPALDVSAIDVGCAPAACRPRIEQQGCALVIDTADCGFGALDGELGARGELCFEPSEALGRCDDGVAARDALRSIHCDGGARAEPCVIDLHAPRAEARLDVARARLLDVPPLDPRGFERPPLGYLSDLALVGGAIVVAGQAHQESWMCAEDQPGLLWSLDADTLAVRWTATVAPCLSQLAADPRGDGVIAVFGGQDAELGRFDHTGRLVDRVRWSRAASNEGHRASSLMVLDGATPLAVVTMTNTARLDDGRASELFVVDLSRFEERATVALGEQLRELAPYDGRELLAIDDSFAGLVYIDPSGPSLRRGPSLLGSAVRSIIDLGQAHAHAATGRLLATATGIGGGVFVFTGADELIGRARPFELPGDVWAIAPWPADPRLVLVGITGREAPRRASVALVDPAGPRFLPGVEVIGDGAIGRLRPDGRGNTYTVLPWTAEVVRISAAQVPR